MLVIISTTSSSSSPSSSSAAPLASSYSATPDLGPCHIAASADRETPDMQTVSAQKTLHRRIRWRGRRPSRGGLRRALARLPLALGGPPPGGLGASIGPQGYGRGGRDLLWPSPKQIAATAAVALDPGHACAVGCARAHRARLRLRIAPRLSQNAHCAAASRPASDLAHGSGSGGGDDDDEDGADGVATPAGCQRRGMVAPQQIEVEYVKTSPLLSSPGSTLFRSSAVLPRPLLASAGRSHAILFRRPRPLLASAGRSHTAV